MGEMQHFNHKYTGNVPNGAGDRYYGQDMVLDFKYFQEYIGKLALSMMQDVDVSSTNGYKLTGEIATVVDFTHVSIPVQRVLAPWVEPYKISAWGSPPTPQSETRSLIVESVAESNFDISGGNLDGSTINYVHLTYAETDDIQRAKAKGAGNWYCYVKHSYAFTISATPGLLGADVFAFVGDGSSFLTIYEIPGKFDYVDYKEYPIANIASASYTPELPPASLWTGKRIKHTWTGGDGSNVVLISDVTGADIYYRDGYTESNFVANGEGYAIFKSDGTHWIVDMDGVFDSANFATGYWQRTVDGQQIAYFNVPVSYEAVDKMYGRWNFPRTFVNGRPILLLTYDFENDSSTPPITALGITDSNITTTNYAEIRQRRIVGTTNFAPGDTGYVFAQAIGGWREP